MPPRGGRGLLPQQSLRLLGMRLSPRSDCRDRTDGRRRRAAHHLALPHAHRHDRAHPRLGGTNLCLGHGRLGRPQRGGSARPGIRHGRTPLHAPLGQLRRLGTGGRRSRRGLHAHRLQRHGPASELLDGRRGRHVCRLRLARRGARHGRHHQRRQSGSRESAMRQSGGNHHHGRQLFIGHPAAPFFCRLVAAVLHRGHPPPARRRQAGGGPHRRTAARRAGHAARLRRGCRRRRNPHPHGRPGSGRLPG